MPEPASASLGGASSAASFGPVIFFGLTAFALINHEEVIPDLPNPIDTVSPELAVELAAPDITFPDAPTLPPAVAAGAPLPFFQNATEPVVVASTGGAEPRRPTGPSRARFGGAGAAGTPYRGPLPPAAGLAAGPAGTPLRFVPDLEHATVNAFFVNARQGPGLFYDSLAQYMPGQRVIVTDRAADWARINVIEADGTTLVAWMYDAYLTPDGTAQALAGP
ncbi:MAG: SH3 domain-containing protein [Pseudomonadota bacterium]